MYKKISLERDEHIIDKVESKQRGKIVDKYLNKSRVSESDIGKLPHSQKKEIILRELDLEKHRVNNNLKVIIAVGGIALVAYWISTTVEVESIDDGPSLIKCYQDSDGDGFGDPNYTLEIERSSCPENFVSNSDDTDDSDNLRYKGESIWYQDADEDGYGNPLITKICRLPLGRYHGIVEFLVFKFVGFRAHLAQVFVRSDEVVGLAPGL